MVSTDKLYINLPEGLLLASVSAIISPNIINLVILKTGGPSEFHGYVIHILHQIQFPKANYSGIYVCVTQLAENSTALHQILLNNLMGKRE